MQCLCTGKGLNEPAVEEGEVGREDWEPGRGEGVDGWF